MSVLAARAVGGIVSVGAGLYMVKVTQHRSDSTESTHPGLAPDYSSPAPRSRPASCPELADSRGSAEGRLVAYVPRDVMEFMPQLWSDWRPVWLQPISQQQLSVQLPPLALSWSELPPLANFWPDEEDEESSNTPAPWCQGSRALWLQERRTWRELRSRLRLLCCAAASLCLFWAGAASGGGEGVLML